jgi:probable addiction module antidote protein
MTKKKMKKIKTTLFDPADYIKDETDARIYMEEAMKFGDPAFITHALGTIARARGMSKIAKRSGMSRESLYKALSKKGNPELGTVMRVMQAVGLKLSVERASAR